MTPLMKRLLIAAVVLVLGAAGMAFRAGIVMNVTNALGITGRSAPKMATAKPGSAPQPAARSTGTANSVAGKTGPASPGAAPQAGEAQKSAPTPIQASAGMGLSPAAPGGKAPAPAFKPGPARTAKTGPPAPMAAGLTPPATQSSSSASASAAERPRALRPGGPAAEPFIDPTERLSSWVREPYIYTSLGRRDPFGSLLSGEFVGDGEPGLVDVGNLKLVGIAWDQADRFAMVEDPRGFGYVLRKGDPVRSGKVLRINRTSVTFLQSMGGESNTITIELPMQEGKVR